MLGKTFSHYEVTRALGVGAMGEVYAARDKLLGRTVAIKILQAEIATEESRLRFLQEARAVSALNHPNIVTIYDIVREGTLECIIMELVPGEALDVRLQRGPMPLEEALDVIDGIADALAAAHARGIVHRDLKPANVMLTPSGGLKILDFGLAKFLADFESSGTLQMPSTKSGIVVGTPSFMSPEQVYGQPLDGRTDLFSLGSLGVEMLTGRNPFEEDSVVATMHRIAYGQPPSLDDVPEAAIPIFERLLARDKEARYSSADELRRAIAELREEAGIRSTRTTAAATPRRGTLWRRAAIALASVVRPRAARGPNDESDHDSDR